ncbi:MAG: hypothetical protein Q8J89_02825 [Caulobacter sp.]|nr:hypothetical protein [Caulobacter sp.]
MPTQSPARRGPSLIKLLLTCALIGAVMGAAGGLADGLGLTVPLVVSSVAVLALGVLILWLSARWWAGVDEAVREAHKFSWFWGGSAGMIVVGAVALPLLRVARGAVDGFGFTPADAGMFVNGVGFTLALMLVGYGLCWAGWWIIRNR